MNYLEMERLSRHLLMHYFSWRSLEDRPQLQKAARAHLDGFTEAMVLMGIGGAASTVVMAVEDEYEKAAPQREFALNAVQDKEWRENLIDNLVRRLDRMRNA